MLRVWGEFVIERHCELLRIQRKKLETNKDVGNVIWLLKNITPYIKWNETTIKFAILIFRFM